MVTHNLDLDIATNNENQQEKIDALNEQAWNTRESDPRNGLALSEQAYQLSQNETPVYLQGLAHSSRNLASLHFHTSQYDYSLQKAFEALDLYRQLEQRPNEARMLLIVGQIYESLADYSEALSYTFNALELSEELGDITSAAQNLTRIGAIYHELGKYKPELETYTKALQYYQELKEDQGMAVVFNRMARAYSAQHEYTNAVIYAQNSLRLAQNLQADLLEAEVYCTLGGVYGHLKSYEEALAHYYEAISRAETLSYRRLILEAKLGLGRLYCANEKWSNAIKILEEAIELANGTESRRFVFACHEALAQAYEAIGSYKQALTHYQKFHSAEKQVFNENTQRQLNNLRVLHDTERARKEAEIYELQNSALANEVAERKRIQGAMELSNRALAERIEELSTLNLIAQTLAMMDDFEQVISDVAQTAVALVKGASVVVGLVKAEHKKAEIIYQYSHSCARWIVTNVVSFPDDAMWAVSLESKQPVRRTFEPGGMTEGKVYGEYGGRATDLTHRVCVPLRTRDDVIGVISLTRPDDNGAFTNNDLQLLETIAGLIAVAVENSRLFESEQSQRVLTEARNEELDAFARTVAHDLKNPLSALMSSAEFLQSYHEMLPPDRLQQIYKIMHSSSIKATSIVEELLLLAGVRQQEAAISVLDMEGIVQQARMRLSGQFSECQGVWVDNESWPVALGYGPWVEEVWTNYISNALKYGGRPYSIEVGADLDETTNMVRFWIKDNGKGVPAEGVDQLFVEFSRLDRSKIEGHGLGLSIVKRIVEKLDGTVGYEARPEGGSMFYFTLPQA